VFHQECKSSADTIRPRFRGRIVESNDKIGFRRSPQALLYQVPGFQIVGKRDGAEIVTERGTDARRGRLHCGNARQDFDGKIAPSGLAVFHGFEYGGCHGENAGIAAGYDRNSPPLRGESQRVLRSLHFDAIVARMPKLARPHRHALEIWRVADEVGCLGKHARGFRRQPIGIAGTEPDNKKPTAHGRRPHPGTQIKEKYGAGSFAAVSASARMRSPVIVPRST
jgi:hypothetical protein